MINGYEHIIHQVLAYFVATHDSTTYRETESQTNFLVKMKAKMSLPFLTIDDVLTLLRENISYTDHKYRSGTVNSNTVNSKFHLIWSFFEIFATFLLFHV